MKAQASAELLIAFSALLVLFIVLITIYKDQMIILFQQSKDKLQAADTANRIANAINYVYLAGEGTTYDLPMAVQRANITVSGKIVTVEITNSIIQTRILANVTNFTLNNSGHTIIQNLHGGNIVIS